jgi:hypothetical protein
MKVRLPKLDSTNLSLSEPSRSHEMGFANQESQTLEHDEESESNRQGEFLKTGFIDLSSDVLVRHQMRQAGPCALSYRPGECSR